MRYILNRIKYDFLYEKVYKRISKWFAGYDAWNLDCNLVDWLILRLLWLIKNGNGYPSTKEFATDSGYDDWHETLWEIAKGLACYCLFDGNWYFHLGEKREPKMYKQLTKRVKDSLKAITFYHASLWE